MTINCQVCGTANPDSNKYCDGCGVELTNNAPTTEAASVGGAPATETVSAPSTPVSEGTPTDLPPTPVVASTADSTLPQSSPVTPLTPPEGLGSGTIGSGTIGTGTIGTGTAPNPYQTPLSETMIGQMDSGATVPVESSSVPEATSSTPVSSAPDATTSQATSTSMDAAPLDAAPMDTAAPASTPADSTTAPASLTESPVSTPATPSTAGGAARLGLKKFGQPTGDFIPLNGEKLVVGRFDASSGPVDIDLGEMAGKEHISRHHAELYLENGTWHVRDLGSTNGVFLKKKGEGSFSPRLQEPAALADGDELAFGNVMLTFNQG